MFHLEPKEVTAHTGDSDLEKAKVVLHYHQNKLSLWKRIVLDLEQKHDINAVTASKDMKVQYDYLDARLTMDEYENMTRMLQSIVDALTTTQEIRNGSWINDDDVKRLTRELDVALNGAKAAKQAALCDVVAQVVSRQSIIVNRAILVNIINDGRSNRYSATTLANALERVVENRHDDTVY